jgi:hypothetical protein
MHIEKNIEATLLGFIMGEDDTIAVRNTTRKYGSFSTDFQEKCVDFSC